MRDFELFGRQYDFLLVPAASTLLISLFYGVTAGALSAALVVVAGYLKPLRGRGLTPKQIVIVTSGAALIFSVFWRSIFFNEYCSTAHWAVNGGVYKDFRIQMPCFIAGGYFQYAFSGGWHSILRDIVMPAMGFVLLVSALTNHTGKCIALLLASTVFAFGLWVNRPLLSQGAEEDQGPPTITSETSTSAKQSPPSTVENSAEGFGTAAAPANPAGTGEQITRIPASFLGEWNENLEHCGTGLNPSRMRVQATKVLFYESDAEVSRVTVINSRAVTVEASFAGEGEAWKDTFEMVLSRSGNELSVGEFTRYRC